MNNKARSAAVKALKDDPLKRVMIAGLKCGGQGLNLTMACRVICIDLCVDGVMMDDGRNVPKLSVEELASLFGYLSEDEEGNQVILPDNDRLAECD
ncbi:hypothetical protein FGG08_007080 [Glutinoglossum americanum]|uniref:Uncharacterized protein n=1 Tax=Glutinoglossum americanum TaxID=1670608 RepID=A0A9P8HRH1_9PEZI|nr:hypothetical protein FGG08_007080 [Glutinoglossum americanum]